MRKLASILFRKVKEEKGTSAIEYGLLAALIAVAIIVGAELAGTSLGNLFSGLGTKLSSVPVP